MLKLLNITKNYETGGETVAALKDVSIEFRRNEFVSILGHSGCGKTTLLNIIGGLDRYTSGDLIIDGRSTKEYNDRDWDTYRNHSIGFVFQSYNLIPHQTVLANVELALTLSGVSREQRRKRAIEALEKVGLGNQLNKRPNQMSGGQMQRVAIARALINNPEILLADEPTGALDSETSVQIMALLKEVASDRLVIMVTHNPELAAEYSTRIIKLSDGEIVGDTAPFDSEQEALSQNTEPQQGEIEPQQSEIESDVKKETVKKEKVKKDKKDKKDKKRQKANSMSFLTALSLSLNNLMTKKGRTFMTSFAGSIGIIGIALILSLSSGFQAYIDTVQEETLSSYPIVIEAEQVDMTKLMQSFLKANSDKTREDGKIYANTDMYEMMNSYMNPEVNSNNLEKLMAWIESDASKVKDYATAIQYGYASPLQAYVYDLSKGVLPANDYASLFEGLLGGGTESMMTSMTENMSIDVFQELIPDENGKGINALIYEQYELIEDAMRWPQNKNEVVLIVDKNNEIAETYLYNLGILDRSKIEDLMIGMSTGDESGKDIYATTEWGYADFVGMKFRLILPTEKFAGVDTDGDSVKDTFTDISENEDAMKLVLSSADELEIVGIIRPKEGVTASALTGAIGYTKELTDWYISEINNSEIVKYQKAHPETDVFTGLPFKTLDTKEPTVAEKALELREWIKTATTAQKANAYFEISAVPDDVTLATMVANGMKNYPDRASMEAFIIGIYSQQSDMDEETIKSLIADIGDEELKETIKMMVTEGALKTYRETVKAQMSQLPEAAKAAALENMFKTADDATLAKSYDIVIPKKYSDSTYKTNLELMGQSDMNNPSSVNIYAATFEDKDMIADLIAEYNRSVPEEDRISYTDYVAMMMSSVSTIINVISYVLIAFVSISLVVSSIMIGIITYISVLERTKEIGILRSIGASKKDISRVFNAETLIVGFVAGMIGILTTMLLNIPINLIIEAVGGIKNVAYLPTMGAVLLVAISMVLTFIAGLVPSRVAAKKDPVVALRTE
ncbi:MAG: ABC transporter ATP-binding protein/permease [Ruminococcaceae bacterium]|nr:ABC transporter ATP-binding protein/permease [Oscillospiraceae bacterium]